MLKERFVIAKDHRVLCHGYELGRLRLHPNLTARHKPGRWFAVGSDGIIGIFAQRDLAALAVIRECYPEATLASIDYGEGLQ